MPPISGWEDLYCDIFDDFLLCGDEFRDEKVDEHDVVTPLFVGLEPGSELVGWAVSSLRYSAVIFRAATSAAVSRFF